MATTSLNVLTLDGNKIERNHVQYQNITIEVEVDSSHLAEGEILISVTSKTRGRANPYKIHFNVNNENKCGKERPLNIRGHAHTKEGIPWPIKLEKDTLHSVDRRCFPKNLISRNFLSATQNAD